jgi:hypothetical protein
MDGLKERKISQSAVERKSFVKSERIEWGMKKRFNLVQCERCF